MGTTDRGVEMKMKSRQAQYKNSSRRKEEEQNKGAAEAAANHKPFCVDDSRLVEEDGVGERLPSGLRNQGVSAGAQVVD